MSEPVHQIRRQVLEITASGEAQARQLQHRLASIHRHHLEPILDRCFTAHAPVGTFLRIHRLELDLGSLDGDRLDQSLATALEPALRQALTEVESATDLGGGSFYSDDVSVRPHDPGFPVDSDSKAAQDTGVGATAGASLPAPNEPEASLELLLHYALTGRVPWWAETRDPHLISNALQLLIGTEPQRLRQTLLSLAGENLGSPSSNTQSSAFLRLVIAATDSQLGRLFRVLRGSPDSTHSKAEQRAREWVAAARDQAPPETVWSALLARAVLTAPGERHEAALGSKSPAISGSIQLGCPLSKTP